MNSLEEDQAGVTIDGPQNVKVFLKRNDIEEDDITSQLFKSLITADFYEEQYNERDAKPSDSYLKILLKNTLMKLPYCSNST